MLPIILLALLAAIVVARLCPDTGIGRTLLKAFVYGPAQWLESPRLSQAIPYAIAVTALGLLLFAAPELSVVAAGLDIQLLVDLTLAMSVAVAQVGVRRIRVMAHKTIRALITPLRSNQRKSRVHRARPSRAATDDSDTGAVSLFA